MGYIK